jgi:CheY-like chemotaxis protein
MLYFKNITALIIDDMQDMRSTLRIQLSTLGATHIHQAASIRDAMRLIRENRYDLILCDYYMGDDTSGQQFLEYLRAGRHIPPQTLFVMVTAECSYEAVANAVEFAPDDYLVKPFTAELLKSRVERVWARKEALTPVLDRLGKLDYEGVLREATRLIAGKSRYRHELMRMQGSALLTMERFAEAQALYESVLTERDYAWARFGHARALKGQQHLAAAQDALHALLRTAPSYLEAYDVLIDLYTLQGNITRAQELSLAAAEVSPSVARQKAVGVLAMQAGNLELAEVMLTRAVSRNRHGLLKSPEEYTALARVVTQRGDPLRGLKVLEDAFDQALVKRSVDRMDAKTVEAEAQLELGNATAAKAAIEEAMKAHDAVPPEEVPLAQARVLELARVAIRAGESPAAKELLTKMTAREPDNRELVSRAKGLFREMSEADAQAAEDAMEVALQKSYARNNEAVTLAQQGQLRAAADLFIESAKLTPDNFTINLNVFKSLVMLAQKEGRAKALHEEIEHYGEIAEKLSPLAPSLIRVRGLWERIKQKEGLQ